LFEKGLLFSFFIELNVPKFSSGKGTSCGENPFFYYSDFYSEDCTMLGLTVFSLKYGKLSREDYLFSDEMDPYV